MIFVFQEDRSLDVVEDLEEAQRLYEGIDVADGLYEFFDDRGRQLRPRFTTPNKMGRFLGLIRWVVSGEFELIPEEDAEEARVFSLLREATAVNSNRWFRSLPEVERFLRTSGDESTNG